MREPLKTLLEKARAGDEKAMERVYSAVYPDLRRLARNYLQQERDGHTLQPTDLVNEVFLKVATGKSVEWQSRAQLVAVMARQMRWILVDHARRRKALKRGDTLIPLALSKEPAQKQPRLENVLTINAALEDLERLDKRTAQVVELRVFGGLSETEIASALDIGISTVKRDWVFAKAWLKDRLH